MLTFFYPHDCQPMNLKISAEHYVYIQNFPENTLFKKTSANLTSSFHRYKKSKWIQTSFDSRNQREGRQGENKKGKQGNGREKEDLDNSSFQNT